MRKPRLPRSLPSGAKPLAARLRVIGGTLKGRTILYNGDPGLRPMKDRVREAVFNLVGPSVRDKTVLDLFAGTGAMSIEAISRGAPRAVLIERRFPNIRVIQETAATLEIADRMTIIAGDAFRWVPHHVADVPGPWVAFCCPPYEFFTSRRAEMAELLRQLWHGAPAHSIVVVESDRVLGADELPDGDQWDVREYPPAVVSIARKP